MAKAAKKTTKETAKQPWVETHDVGEPQPEAGPEPEREQGEPQPEPVLSLGIETDGLTDGEVVSFIAAVTDFANDTRAALIKSRRGREMAAALVDGTEIYGSRARVTGVDDGD